MSHPLRVIFAGTPDFAAASLQALLASRHQVVGVYTQPDRAAGRGRKLTASPVKQLAQSHGLPVYQPATLRTPQAQDELAALEADLMVVVAYGLILPREILEAPRLGCINVHASLLPRWRGAAPIQRAIEAGDRESGVTLMQMDEGLDTGDMLLTRRTPITPDTTGGALHDTLARLGGEALVDTLGALTDSSITPMAQPDDGVTHAAKLSKAEAELDFDEAATTLAARVRAFNPWPVTWCQLDNERLRLWLAEPGELDDHETSVPPGTLLAPDDNALRVACRDSALRVTKAQLPGGKPLDMTELLRAQTDRFTAGKPLGTPHRENPA